MLFLSLLILGVSESTTKGQPPGKTEGGTLKLRWESEWKKGPEFGTVTFDRDGTVLICTSRTGLGSDNISFNIRTGKPGLEYKAESFTHRFFPLDKGKIGFQTRGGSNREQQLAVWDPATGKFSSTSFPTAGPGFQELYVPSNLRYYAVLNGQGRDVEAPFKIFDAKTNKAIVSLETKGARAYFTPDASRVLVGDNYDRFRWFKLPSGQLDGEWKYDRENGIWPGNILSMTSDASTLLYYGRSPKQRADGHAYYLIDGKTGEEKHMFPLQWNARTMSMSPEGDMVVVFRSTPDADRLIEVFDTKDTSLARVASPVPSGARRTPTVMVSWEARAIAMYDGEAKKLLVYDLPGGSSAGVATRPKGRDDGDRAAIPNDAAVAKAEATIRQVLKDDYAKKTPADQKAFAQKLIKLAGETADDPVARFVMLRDARDFAQGAADPTLTLQAIDSLAKWYQFDGPAQQLASLEKILAATTATATAKLIAETATASAQAASDVDELDEAVEFAQLAVSAAKKAKFTTAPLDEADANLAQAKKSRDAFATLRPALEKLKSTPDDPVANLAVGKYRCFTQNRWDDGLKHLAKGEDAALRAVAELDVKTPRTGTPEDAKLADAWWEYAQAAPADAQWAAQVRTRYWYAKTVPGLSGLNKARAEGRLGITVGTVEYRPGLLCEFTAPKQPAILKGKKARIDATVDFVAGEFADGTKQTDVTARWTGVLAPTRGGRYTLVAQTNDPVRVKIDGKIVIDTTVGGTPKREASVALGEKVTPIQVDYFALNADKYKIKLAWVAPGSTTEEVIPAECLFHDRKNESALGK